MLIGDFTSKLKKLNSKLYVKMDQRQIIRGLGHSGIYLKQAKQAGLSYDTKDRGHHLVNRYYQELESGQLDKFICGVCLEWIPEFDIYDDEYTKIVIPGWRTTLLRLVQAKAIDLDKAKKVFKCKSLGESDYDKLNFFGKLRFAKKVDGFKD